MVNGFASRAPHNFANLLPSLGVVRFRLRFAAGAYRDPSRPIRADKDQSRVGFLDLTNFTFIGHTQALPTAISSILALPL